MQNWQGAAVVSAPGDPLILLTQIRQLDNGSWRYTYSIAIGRAVTFVTWPGPNMLSPYDSAFVTIAGDLARRYAASPR